MQIISNPKSSSSNSTSRSLLLTASDIPVEIPRTDNNERAHDKHDNIMKTVHMDIVQSMLVTIVENIVKDDSKSTIENNILLDTSKLKKTSELIDELTDIITADDEIINLITKDQNYDTDTNEVKEDAHLESAANENGMELRNKSRIYTSSESGFDITNMNETITESKNKFDSDDINNLSTSLSENANKANESMTVKDQHKRSESVMQDLDVLNNFEEFQDTNNIELTQNKELLSIILPEEIFSLDGLNHTGSKKVYAEGYIKVANDSAHIVNDHTKFEDVNKNMTNFSASQMEENGLTPEKDKMTNTNRFKLQDEAHDSKNIEVANNSEKIENDDVLTTSEEINENMPYFSTGLMEENDFTPEKNKMNNTNRFNLQDNNSIEVTNNKKQISTNSDLTKAEEVNETMTENSCDQLDENGRTSDKSIKK